MASSDTVESPFLSWKVQPYWTKLVGVTFKDGKLLQADPIAKANENEPLILEAEAAREIDFQPQAGNRSSGVQGEIIQVYSDAVAYSPQKDESAGGGRYIDYVERAVYPFVLEKPGRHRIFLRVQVPAKAQWTVDIRADGGEKENLTLPEMEPDEWIWMEGPLVMLEEGEHVLEITGYHNGSRLDQIAILDASASAPEGIYHTVTPLVPPPNSFISALGWEWPKNVEWKVSKSSRQHGLQGKMRGAGEWAALPDGWQQANAQFQLKAGKEPIPLEEIMLDVRIPLTEVEKISAGDGVIWFHPASGRILAMEGPAFPVLTMPLSPIFGISWWDETGHRHSSKAEQWQYRPGGPPLTWHYLHQPTGVELTLSVESSEKGSRWTALTDNRSSFRIAEVEFPNLPALVSWRADEELIWPGVTSQRIQQPALSFRHREHYPRACMNWLALSKPGASVYLSREDPQARINSILRAPDRTRQGVSLSMAQVDSIAPGERAESVSTLAVLKSDWKAAADLYRDWFYSVFGKGNYAQWIQYGHGFYDIGIQHFLPVAFYGENEQEIDAAWWFGISHLQIWGHGPILTCCPNYYYPDPGRGGEKEFKRYISTLRKNGFTVGTYFHPNSLNPLFSMAENFRGIAKDSLPEELQPPTLQWFLDRAHISKPGQKPKLPSAEEVAIMNEQGGGLEENGRVPRLFSPINWDESWQRYMHFWVDRYREEYGVILPYFDTLAFSPKGPEFSEAIGFGDGKQAQRMRHFIDKVLQKQTASLGRDGTGFMAEGYTDFWAKDGAMLLSGFRWAPEVIRYTFPEHLLLEGGSNGFWRAPKDRIALGKSFADGNLLDMLAARSALSQISWMRESIREWLPLMQYRYDEYIASVPPNVHVRYFQGNGYGLFTWFQEGRATAPLKLTAPAPGTRWYLLGDDGRAKILEHSGDAEIELPEAETGIIFAVTPKAKLPHKTVTLLRTRPGWKGSDLAITHLNLSGAAATTKLQITDFDSQKEFRTRSVNLKANEIVYETIFVPVDDLPRRLLFKISGEILERRRLAVAPVTDPDFQKRRYFEGRVMQETRQVLQIGPGPSLRASRNLYIPQGKTGKVTISYKSENEAHLHLSVTDSDTGASKSIQLPQSPAQDWEEASFEAKGNSGWLRLSISASGSGKAWIRSLRVNPLD